MARSKKTNFKEIYIKGWMACVVKKRDQLYTLPLKRKNEVRINPALVRPPNEHGWKVKINPDIVWESFEAWVSSEHPLLIGAFDRKSFFIGFYKATNTKKSTTSGRIRLPFVTFEKWGHYNANYANRRSQKTIAADTNVAQQRDSD